MKKEKGRFLPYVEVTWEDAHTLADKAWQSLKDADDYASEPVLCTTIGALVKKTKAGMIIAQSITSGGQVGGLWYVPAGMVRKVRRMRVSKR